MKLSLVRTAKNFGKVLKKGAQTDYRYLFAALFDLRNEPQLFKILGKRIIIRKPAQTLEKIEIALFVYNVNPFSGESGPFVKIEKNVNKNIIPRKSRSI